MSIIIFIAFVLLLGFAAWMIEKLRKANQTISMQGGTIKRLERSIFDFRQQIDKLLTDSRKAQMNTLTAQPKPPDRKATIERQIQDSIAESLRMRAETSVRHREIIEQTQKQHAEDAKRAQEHNDPMHQLMNDLALHGVAMQRTDSEGNITRVAPADIFKAEGGIFDGNITSGDHSETPTQ